MKIIHVTTCRNLSNGQRKQLTYEVEAASSISDFDWNVVAFHTGRKVNDFERTVPKFFSAIFVRNLFFWFHLIKISKDYDFVIHRHINFDPFSLIFSKFVRNRVTVHHSKEIEELKLIRPGVRGQAASLLERFCGSRSLKNNLGVLGVTREIAEYECVEHGLSIPCFSYPNGVSYNRIRDIGDMRASDFVNAVFICGKFSKWHGLDVLLDSLLDDTDVSGQTGWCLHLIGDLSGVGSDVMRKIGASSLIKVHGYLSEDEYIKIIEKCDVGFGSFAMWRENLSEGATLKVRELLAMGIPVISGHLDTSIPHGFEYYKYVDSVSPQVLLDYAYSVKGVSRAEIRRDSRKYIEKRQYMEGVARWLADNFC